jgi:hypothetical protein
MKPNSFIDGGGDSVDTNADAVGAAAAAAAAGAATAAAQGKSAALALGITETVLKAFPELKPIFDMFVAGNIAQARLAYFETNYYKNLTGTAQKRQTQKATQRGAYDQEFDAWKQAQKVRLINKGFTWNADIEAMLEDSYLKGDSDTQLQIKILNSGKMGRIGGSALGAVNSLREYAEGQGVNKILPASYWDKVSTAILSDSITVEDVQEEIKGFAISAFPAYATGIQQGRTFGMQTSALRQLIANTLEVDVDTVTNDNPMFKQLTGYLNPKTQTPEIIPLWQAEKVIKSSDQWLYTKNARDTFDTLGLKVLRDWGLA